MIRKISFILPAYNEEESIKKFIDEIYNLNLPNFEVIAVDNNSSDKTALEIKKTKALYLFEPQQGYGAALFAGLEIASGDILVMCEPDGTFKASDFFKFVPYIEDFDAVFGTRTSKSLILKGAKMNFFLRYGNIFVAKFLSLFFSGVTLTDVGCTFKVFKKNIFFEIKHKLKVKDSTFQPELMIAILEANKSIVEIPIFYQQRLGYSKITYDFISSFILGLKMIILILRRKFFKFFY